MSASCTVDSSLCWCRSDNMLVPISCHCQHYEALLVSTLTRTASVLVFYLLYNIDEYFFSSTAVFIKPMTHYTEIRSLVSHPNLAPIDANYQDSVVSGFITPAFIRHTSVCNARRKFVAERSHKIKNLYRCYEWHVNVNSDATIKSTAQVQGQAVP